MNKIVRRMWDRDLTLAKWSKLNGFNPRYVQAILDENNVRGKWCVGKAKKIKLALVNQGLMTKEESGLPEE